MISYQVPKQFPLITYQNPFVLIKFQTIPIKFLLFSSITHQNLFVPIKFPKIPLVPISNSSKSFCFHQVPIKFLLFPSSSYQNLFVPIIFPSTSHCPNQLHFVPNPTLHIATQSSKLCERLGQSAKRSAPVPGQAGRGAPVAGGRLPHAAEQKGEIFCLPRLVEDRG